MPDSWSTDLLFSPAPKQYSYPDFRDLSRPSRAEFIQPSLEPLQPSFEDVMDFEATIRGKYNLIYLAFMSISVFYLYRIFNGFIIIITSASST